PNAARARELAEDALARGQARAIAVLADMLANGEGGGIDGKRALELLRSKLAADSAANHAVLARLYLDNRFTGPRPREAAVLLARSPDIGDRIQAAALLADH